MKILSDFLICLCVNPGQHTLLPASCPGHLKLSRSGWREGCCLEPASPEIAVV